MRVLVLALLSVLWISSGCTATEQPRSVIHDPVDPSLVRGTDHGPADQLAATVLTAAQHYWSARAPQLTSQPWRALNPPHSVDTTRPESNATTSGPPCATGTQEVTGNAFYCAPSDSIVWDRAALLPVLRDKYGDAAVAVVVAHEMGHAVQHRAGIDLSGNNPPPEQLETAADCSAGAFLRWVHAGNSDRVQLSDRALDDAARGLTVFRDSVGQRADNELHGNSYERVSALRDGYRNGPGSCNVRTPEPANAPASRTTNEDPAEHPQRALPEALDSPRLTRFFSAVAAEHGVEFRQPRLRDANRVPPRCATEAPTASCSAPPSVVVNQAALRDMHHEIGDQATETVLAIRYAHELLRQTGEASSPPGGPTRQELCLAGAHTSRLAQRDELSDSDLDEAVEVVLEPRRLRTGDADGSRADAPGTTTTATEQFDAFRSGMDHGTNRCG